MNTRLVGGRMLRCGYTTGSCAAAAAKAAAKMLLAQAPSDKVTLTTPSGVTLTLDVLGGSFGKTHASCAVQKDSGDDPDITNGCLVHAHVSLSPCGVEISGGEGVGLVTKPGLDQPVGAHAINTVPRREIREECEAICREYGYKGGLSVVISIPGGEELAERTFNPRLGIVGGLSILGTTGIVEPMSQAALTETTRIEMNMLYEAGHRDILITVGNHGEAFARDVMRLPMNNHVKCSNFIGHALSSAAEIGFSRARLIGHIGKLAKLGIGITNTHSSQGDGRIETLLACALEAGADIGTMRRILSCVSTDAALDCLHSAGIKSDAMQLLAERVRCTLARQIASHLSVNVVCFSGLGDKMQEVFSI